jgi:hypothetical protein
VPDEEVICNDDDCNALLDKMDEHINKMEKASAEMDATYKRVMGKRVMGPAKKQPRKGALALAEQVALLRKKRAERGAR